MYPIIEPPQPAHAASGIDLNAEGVPRMSVFVEKAIRFLKSEDGPTAVEYAVMLAMIIIVCLAAVSTLGTNTSSTFKKISQSI